MSAPPRPANVVRALSVCLALCVVALAAALFGVRMEVVAPANGVVTSASLTELRARQSGLVEMKLRTGDEAGAGDTVAVIQPNESFRLNDYWREVLPEWNREPIQKPEPQIVQIPPSSPRWLTLDVRVSNGQRVQAGDVLAIVTPIDPQTKRPVDLCVRLEFEEKHFGEVAVHQPARFSSTMYNSRLFGRANGHIDRMEPGGAEDVSGIRHFYAIAKLDDSPFEMKIGSTVKAEVITGRRPLFRVILEH